MHKAKREPTEQERIAAFFASKPISHQVVSPPPRRAIKGSRIELVSMHDDPDPIQPGTKGTVEYIDSIQAFVKWDNGRTLNLALPQDQYKIIS